MGVKSKFKCEGVTDYGDTKSISLRAVTSGSEENKNFSKYTPSGEVRFSVDSDLPAADYFKPKKEYYLTFEAADKA